MKKKHFLHTFFVTGCLLVSSFLFSQSIKITGTVIADNGRPVPYSSVSLISLEDTSKIYGDLTDEKGNFSIDVIPGEYEITVDQVGFESYFDQKSLFESTSLGNMEIRLAGKELEEVIVQGTAPIYRVELDKKIYDVTQDLTARGGTLSDVMQNVPSLSVDVDGTVSLRGNDNVKILIDGKPSAMLGISDTGEALKMIPADMVERIEVVTNASARYEASGTAGIINIITKKNKKAGITGSIEVLGGTPQLYGTNINLGYGKKKWNWFANAGLRYSKSEGENSYLYSKFNPLGDEISRSLQNGTREREGTGFNFSTGFNFNFNENNSLTTSVGYRTSRRNGLGITNYDDIFPIKAYSQRKETQHNNEHGIDGSLNFTHNFLKKGNVLTVDGNFNYTTDDSNSDIYDSKLGKSLNNNNRTGFMIKSDYVLPFKEGSQLEAGVRADYSKTKTDFSLNETDGSGIWTINPGYTDKTHYEENILSAYIQYGNKFGDFSFLAGLREETSFIKVKSDKENSSITKDYTDLFPTLHLNYNFSEKSQLQVSYSRRVNRPRSRMLIPYKNLSDNRNTFQGNPDLDPSYTDSYELGFNIQNRVWGITPSVYYQRTNNPFQRITLSDASGNLNTMPVNLGYENRYGGELSYTINPFQWWRIFGEINLFQYENFGENTYTDVITGIEKTEDLAKKGFTWRTRLNMTLKIPTLFNLQLQGSYSSPRKMGQNEMKEMYGLNVGISKDVLKGKGTILLNVQDVFNSRKMKQETFGENFYQYSEMQWRPRQITLSFTYRFNRDLKNGKSNKRNRPQQDGNNNNFDLEEIETQLPPS
ncbi:MAG: TonB-dependent receptor [Flavobacteriaceae bacterium]|jgi:outer membrane receptor protein involved in Fe transport|nr:TonB-dependent receptor [Flavobacteriaceae bacterium]